jgi:hypothetical protein
MTKSLSTTQASLRASIIPKKPATFIDPKSRQTASATNFSIKKPPPSSPPLPQPQKQLTSQKGVYTSATKSKNLQTIAQHSDEAHFLYQKIFSPIQKNNQLISQEIQTRRTPTNNNNNSNKKSAFLAKLESNLFTTTDLANCNAASFKLKSYYTQNRTLLKSELASIRVDPNFEAFYKLKLLNYEASGANEKMSQLKKELKRRASQLQLASRPPPPTIAISRELGHLTNICRASKLIFYESERDLKMLSQVKCNLYEVVHQMEFLDYLKKNFLNELMIMIDGSNDHQCHQGVNVYQCVKVLLELISGKRNKVIVVNI